jgi:hypothetical protein
LVHIQQTLLIQVILYDASLLIEIARSYASLSLAHKKRGGFASRRRQPQETKMKNKAIIRLTTITKEQNIQSWGAISAVCVVAFRETAPVINKKIPVYCKVTRGFLSDE